MLDLVFAMLAIGRLEDLSARDKGAALGGSAAPGPAPKSRRSPAEVRAAFRNPTKEHAKVMPEFGTAFERQNAPKSLHK